MERRGERLIKVLIVSLVGVVVFCSCHRELDRCEFNQTLSEDRAGVIREVSMLLGDVLRDRSILNRARELMLIRGDNSEAISLSALLCDTEGMKDYERMIFEAHGMEIKEMLHCIDDAFKSRMISILRRSPDRYPIISEALNTKGEEADIESLNQLYIFRELELYFPYEEEFDWDKIDKITVTFDPIIRETWSQGALYEIGKSDRYREVIVDDDYAFLNPTIVVRPIEERKCDSDKVFKRQLSSDNLGSPIWEGWLTHNTDYTTIHQDDILKVVIPKIRVTEHLATLFSSSTVSIYRVSGNLHLDQYGLIIPSATHFRILYKFDIKRRDTRLGLWSPVDIIWDGDWDMHEANQQIVFISHHTFYWLDKTISGKVGIGYDNKKKRVVPEAKITANFSFIVDGGDIRYNNQISRRDALAHIVGDNGAGTVLDGGIYYSIKRADVLQYYFKFYYTQIVPRQ